MTYYTGVKMQSTMTIQEWFGETLTATFLLSMNTLGVTNFKVIRMVDTLPQGDLIGVYMPFLIADGAATIGFFTSQEGCRQLSKMFLKSDEDAEELLKEDTTDAFKEVVNIFSGLLKRQMYDHKPIIDNGMPHVSEGAYEISEDQQFVCGQILIGDVEAYLFIVW